MNWVREERIWPLRLLVLLLLISAQSFLLAHELDHAPGRDTGFLCDVCSTGHGLDSAVTIVLEPPVNCATQDLNVREPTVTNLFPVTTYYIARAPPLNYTV